MGIQHETFVAGKREWTDLLGLTRLFFCSPVQGFRLQKQREMAECIAYAESLKGDGYGKGLVLTPEVAHGFRDAVEDSRQRSEGEGKNEFAGSGDATADERNHDDDRSLKAALRVAVAREHPEATRSCNSGSSSNYNSNSTSGRRDNSGAFGDEGGLDGTDDFSEYSQHGSGAARSRANSKSGGRELTSTGGRGGYSDRRGKGERRPTRHIFHSAATRFRLGFFRGEKSRI